MRIALIGYGKMGHAIEALAAERGHEVTVKIDKDESGKWKVESGEWKVESGEWKVESGKWKVERGKMADVAIEFTTPATAADNVLRCLEMGMPVVCGTTGWYARYDEVSEFCRRSGGRLVAATNFSVGVNIMFALNRRLAELMRGRGYAVDIAETHHIHKLDAPSGTALTLQEQIVESGERTVESVPIASYREGEVPGTHVVRYSSEADTLTLTHEAHSRRGLAEGALIAAEWLMTAPAGVYNMQDVLGV